MSTGSGSISPEFYFATVLSRQSSISAGFWSGADEGEESAELHQVADAVGLQVAREVVGEPG